MQKNNLININHIDTCKIIKLDSLNSELSMVLFEYRKFKAKNYYKNNEKRIIFIDLKKLNDSTNIYIITETMYLRELLQNIPTFYHLQDNSLICIYTGKENINNIDYECIEQLFLTGKNYCIDSIDAYSKKDLKFITKHRPVFFYDPPIIKIIVCKGKIAYIDFVTTYPARLYEKNMKNKIIIY
ncbi:hypothetical protein KAZ01_02765 [Candidatus Gracilibacteria bacterium]|nr:hypothetical protein [Candidatus Gracilibacteria bacterium]